MAVIRRVSEETPRPIREVNPDIPQQLCQLIERLHAKKPADRPASASEVADLLAQGAQLPARQQEALQDDAGAGQAAKQ